jgi:hypothetical protein
MQPTIHHDMHLLQRITARRRLLFNLAIVGMR